MMPAQIAHAVHSAETESNMNDDRPGTALLTDRPWPNDHIEREVIETAGFRLVTGPAVAGSSSEIEALAAQHRPCAILTCWAPVSAEAIAKTGDLRVITRLGVGLDNIAVEAAADRGVQVTNVPDYCVEEVSDHAVALLVSWARKIVEADRHVRSDGWSAGGLYPRRISALTCGVIGFGRTGRVTTRTLKALGAKVIVHTPRPPSDHDDVDFLELDELLRRSDVVILHAPLTDTTRHLIGTAELQKMPRGSYLINVSRGGLVDTKALVAALTSGHLAGAGLDVLESEPDIHAALLDHQGVTLTPHIGFSSEVAVTELRRRAAEDVVRVLRGQSPLNPCNHPTPPSNGVAP
ncbi:C-terminal binding protein [Rhodococcus sp. NPDC055112]